MSHLLDLAADPTAWVALATLVAMEVVLGIDNLVFVALLTNQLPAERRVSARRVGLGLALVLRLLLLASLVFIVGLTHPVLALFGHPFSLRDLILLAGGLFLLWKATTEIRQAVDPKVAHGGEHSAYRSFASAIAQILILDLVFSIDSILTAVGMTSDLTIMVAAVLIAVALMLWAAGPLSDFIRRNPSVVLLALGFLLMIGMTLIAEGFGTPVPKGYIYAAMAFAALVESLNLFARSRQR